MSDFEMLTFDDLIEDCTKYGTKLPTNDYRDSGKNAIIDQGQNYIAGYTDRDDGLYSDVPAIIFGDHTRVFKYVDFPFFLGADGVKILKAKKAIDYKYLYYYFEQAQFPNTGYARHFKWLKELAIPYPPLAEQKHIAAVLDKCSSVIALHKTMLAKYDTLIKSRFIEMFGDPVTNSMGWEVKKLRDTADVITGNTPPRADKNNYGNFIEWIKTDNITEKTYITEATEHLSEQGEKIGRTVDANSILMACIAGSLKSIGRVALTNRKVAFNQQINAIVPKSYNHFFLYVLFQMTQTYAQSTVDMALKGILSKGKLENLSYILPPLALQQEFAAFVRTVDAQKSAVQKSLEKAETLYKALMQQYFC